MKNSIKFLLAIIPAITFAQPIINNAENFTIGTVLKFVKCNSENVNPGNAGAKQIWNFSSLVSLKDTVTEWMVDPATTPDGDMFSNSNLAEKYSDGKYVYANINKNQNFLMGFVETRSKMIIKYIDPMLFAQRPITYGTKITDNFSEEFTVNNMDFVGGGTVTLNADGYGTLILRHIKYKNVMRLKITQTQTDTLAQFNKITTMVSTTYVWFDETHTSALFKISSTDTEYYKSKTVEFLISEQRGKSEKK